MLTGSCLCGAVTFTATETAKDPAACHCTQCRKVQGDVRWFNASDTAKRGFCSTCGSSLFWKSHAEDEIGVAMGALDGPTGLTLTRHIFTQDKGDYYQISPELDA